jgi:hypothetical protein
LEIFVNALNLSPYAVSIQDGEQDFTIFLRELPGALIDELRLLTMRRKPESRVYGLRRLYPAWLYRMYYRPLNADCLTLSRPLLDRKLYADIPVWFLEGAYADSIPF